jgi:vancomycin resistance protein YoaR
VAGYTVVGLVVLFGAAWVGLYLINGSDAPRNARVEGVRIGGLGPDEAEQRLRDDLADRAAGPIKVGYGDGRSVSVAPRTAGLSVDYAASIEQAGGGSSFGLRRMWLLVTGGGDNHAEVAVDKPRMQAVLDRLDKGLGAGPVEGAVGFQAGRAVSVPSRAGRVVDRSATQALLKRRFLHEGSQRIPTEVREPQVDDTAVQQALAEFAEPAMSGPVTLVLGGKQVVAPPRLFGQGLSMVPQDGSLVPRVDGEAMLEALTPVMGAVDREPMDARIVVKAGRPRVVPAKVGLEPDPQELEGRFAEVAVREGAQRRIDLEGQATQPDLTTAEARALKVTERVSTFTTNFPYAEYRNVNLARAAELIDGTLLRPGETFSLNGIVGERTAANGFTEGYVVSDGIFKTDLGGGVSQIATTTFNAMFFAGLEDVEHKPHSVYIDRYPEGREATVAWPSLDLKFKNNSPHGVLVKARVDPSTPSSEGAATVSMYSTKQWRITSTTGPRTDFRQPQVRYLQDADCEEASGTEGFSVDVFRHFRDLESGKVLRREKFHTDYIAGDIVRCGAPPTPEPPKAQPPKAQPPKAQPPKPQGRPRG